MSLPGSIGALPTIKCSNCGVDIDIERMADHLCGPVSNISLAKPAPRSFKDAFSNMSINQSAPAPFRQKQVPQPIDSIVANGSFLGRTTLAPAIQTANYKPVPSVITRKPPFTPPQHGVSTFPRAPSPELSLPQDCAFPAFPLPSKSPVTRRPENSKTFAVSVDMNNKIARNPAVEVSSSTNSVAPLRQQSQSGHTQEEQRPKEPVASAHAFWNPVYKQQTEQAAPHNPYQSTPNTTINFPAMASTPRRLGNPVQLDRKKSVSAANKPLDDIGSVRTHRSAASRSGIAYMASEYGQPRSASAQGHLYGGSTQDRPPPMPDTVDSQGHNIVRSASAMEAHKYSAYAAPPLPTQTHTRSDSRNLTGHISSDSTSSNQSETSQPATSSSRSSPPNSPPRRMLRDDVGNIHNRGVQGLGIQSDQPIGPAAVKSFSRPIRSQPNSATSSPDLSRQISPDPQQSIKKTQIQAPGVLSPDTLEQVSAGPWQSFSQGRSQPLGVLSPETLGQVSAGPWQTHTQKESHSQETVPGVLSPETLNQVSGGPWQSEPQRGIMGIPMNDVPQNNTRHVLPEPMSRFGLKGNTLPALRLTDRTSANSTDFKESARSAVVPSMKNHNMFGSSPSPHNNSSLRRAATVSKGKCRGCSQSITGKSVSSADGRLTGRWHKHCFTCKTCSEPFPTMDFYVFGNDPYCNRHYHQLNKSLCSSCDRGIEGQYVENEQQKFHPHCFSCSECHLILRDTYFDLNGKIYCERHAFKPSKSAFPGPGRRYPEKRFTRVMMI